MIDWKLTKKAKEYAKMIENDEEIDSADFGCSDGFWYAIGDGGYFNPNDALEDAEQIKKVMEALNILQDLEENVYNKLNPNW